MQQPPHRGAKMFTIILVQTFSPHSPIVGDQPGQQVDCAMSNIVKLLAFDLTGHMGCVGWARCRT